MADFISPITDLVVRVWDCSKQHINVLRRVRENLDKLRNEMTKLKELRNDVKHRVDTVEAQQMVPTHTANGWLQRVQDKEGEVDAILQEGSEQIGRRCFSGCCPKNCWTSYKFGKKVTKELAFVVELKNQGDFPVVAERPLPPPVQAMPENPTEGFDPIFEKAWKLLMEDEVRVMGLFGMGGVGKTTLLKKINNAFLDKTGVFDFIIWVVISQEVYLERVQKDIGERLGLPWPEIKDKNSGAHDIYNALVKKNFVLLLDDIWKPIDLLSIGIPLNSSQMCKVVFTTRSEDVCGRMEAKKKVKIECLNWDQAWSLFQEKVGQEALSSNSEIPKLAECVANECGGLPLALITIGRAMACRKTAQEWKYAITVLQQFVGEFSGTGDEMFPLLKFSYDNLPDDTTRSCFLYCSLYPEDHSIYIEDLIEKWIGERYIQGFDNYEDAYNKGYHIIGTLKAMCLLETGDNDSEVKMHDVIRDLSLWIGCDCGKKPENVLVKSCKGLTEAPNAGKWLKAQRISLFNTSISQLGDIPNCLNLSTLLLRGNYDLRHIHDNFFLHMPALRVLDLFESQIEKLPTSIGVCVGLKILDLSFTKFRKSERLKYVGYDNYTFRVVKIPRGVIMCLRNLQILKLGWHKFENLQEGVEELECLGQLILLDINILSFQFLESFLHSNRLLLFSTRDLEIDGWIECNEIFSLKLSPSTSDLCLGYMKMLRRLCIRDCGKMKYLKIYSSAEEGLFKSLETMVLATLPDLIISWERENLHRPCFSNLSHITLSRCGSLTDLTWVVLAPNIRYLDVISCYGIIEIISSEPGGHNENTFSKLINLELRALPNLRSIFNGPLPFPSLEEIKVIDCSLLTRLPLDADSAHNSLKSIKGGSKWWNSLDWDDETVKDTFIPFFVDYRF